MSERAIGWFLIVLLLGGAVLDEHRLAVARDDIGQLKTDRVTVQEQIAAEQARTRQLEAVVQQLLTDRAQTSASVTSVPAGPYCNLHDIQVQNPGC